MREWAGKQHKAATGAVAEYPRDEHKLPIWNADVSQYYLFRLNAFSATVWIVSITVRANSPGSNRLRNKRIDWVVVRPCSHFKRLLQRGRPRREFGRGLRGVSDKACEEPMLNPSHQKP